MALSFHTAPTWLKRGQVYLFHLLLPEARREWLTIPT